MFVHLTLVPYLAAAGELKTKPTQHSVKELQAVGIRPDLIICRAERPIPEGHRQKIAQFCNIRPEAVIQGLDVDTIYQVPLDYHDQSVDLLALEHFGIEPGPDPDLSTWKTIVTRLREPEGAVNIVVAGKYTDHADAYKSLAEALTHGGIANNVRVNARWVGTEQFENNRDFQVFDDAHGILVPGGFGERGSEGKIAVAQFAREQKIPYFGICFGMQMAVIEVARHLAGIEGAGSTEFGNCSDPVVGLLTEWQRDNNIETRTADADMGGTMRLGAYPAAVQDGTLLQRVYGENMISERHRHRYEVNIDYRERLEGAGLRISALSPDGTLPEVVELVDHPWFVGVQYHPELKSKPFAPHPLFTSFVSAALDQSRLV
jgi:CTP synthase